MSSCNVQSVNLLTALNLSLPGTVPEAKVTVGMRKKINQVRPTLEKEGSNRVFRIKNEWNFRYHHRQPWCPGAEVLPDRGLSSQVGPVLRRGHSCADADWVLSTGVAGTVQANSRLKTGLRASAAPHHCTKEIETGRKAGAIWGADAPCFAPTPAAPSGRCSPATGGSSDQSTSSPVALPRGTGPPGSGRR